MTVKIKYYVRSIPDSPRRDRMGDHFKEKLGDFEYWDNAHYDSEEFKNFVSRGGVSVVDNYNERINYYSNLKYPSNKTEMLTPGQAANFYSMISLFKRIANDDSDVDIYGICEDDIIISDGAGEIFQRCLSNIEEDMFIIAVSWGLKRKNRMDFRKVESHQYRLRRNIFRMCNPFFFTNKKTIKYILNKFGNMKIDVPCDSWLHACLKTSSPEIARMGIYPCLVKEMSYSGLVDSDVYPKASWISNLRSKGMVKEAEEAFNKKTEFRKNLRQIWRDNYGI